MAQFEQHFVQDLTQQIKVRHCGSIVFNADNESNVVSVRLFNGSEPVAISGSVVGAVVCSDGSTVPLTGSYSGNTASITLTGDCFAVLGQIGVGIQIVNGTQKTTVLKVIYNVETLTTENVVDPGSRITLEVGDLIAAIDEAVATIPEDYSALSAHFPATGKFVVGTNTSATEENAVAEGEDSVASGLSSHAEGYASEASGDYSHSEGGSVASGGYSHAEGSASEASGDNAHAEGYETTASSDNSHSEGWGTTASGMNAHAEGVDTVASGNQSHSEGEGTIANHAAQSVSGTYNVADPSQAAATAKGTYAEIVGNGIDDDTRSNARTLDWSGNEELAGDLTINKNGQNEMTVGQELSDLKSKINVLEPTATAQDVGKALIAKNVTNGKVTEYEFGEAGGADPEVIEQAVNDWLDEHPEATTTVDFSVAVKVFPTVADMIADDTLKTGDNVATRGYYESGDNGGANYVVSSSHSGVFYITLSNGLYANMLSEKGILPAEAIGIKAYAAETSNPQTSDMDSNTSKFNSAVSAGIRLIFGRGHFYFNDVINFARNHTYSLFGIGRELSILHFPESAGFCFDQPIYYGYYLLRGFSVDSYGHCIYCVEDCLTVLDSHFEWLKLTSQTGDCFHAPSYNVAHYVTTGGQEVYDTCVQNCVFDFINASAPSGAAFANIMGMRTYYMHMNLVSCKYGFRNCDGIIDQLNTLGTSEDYFIYYDKANSYSLMWLFINVNAEGVSKAFIYTEPEVATPSGEDPKKPETANVMTLSKVTAIHSGWSLAQTTDHDVYPITVHSIAAMNLINSDTLVIPSKYPASYDTSVVNAHIHALRSVGFSQYVGGPDITVKVGNEATIFQIRGEVETRKFLTAGNALAYNGFGQERPQYYTELMSPRIFGGKALEIWMANASEIGSQPNAPEGKEFFDTFVVNVDTDTDKRLISLMTTTNPEYPGRIITVCNHKNSLHNLILNSANTNRSIANFGLSKDIVFDVILAPGEYITLMLGYETNPVNGNIIKNWKIVKVGEDADKDWVYDAIISMPANLQLIPFTSGAIYTNGTSVNIQDVKAAAFSNGGTYGFTYAVIPCLAGDEYTIIHGQAGPVAKLWAFIDSSGVKLTSSANNAKESKAVITAPANAAYLVVNTGVKTALFKSN